MESEYTQAASVNRSSISKPAISPASKNAFPSKEAARPIRPPTSGRRPPALSVPPSDSNRYAASSRGCPIAQFFFGQLRLRCLGFCRSTSFAVGGNFRRSVYAQLTGARPLLLACRSMNRKESCRTSRPTLLRHIVEVAKAGRTPSEKTGRTCGCGGARSQALAQEYG
jgi:hypothetical protein